MARDRTIGWLSSTFVLALSVGILLAPPAGGSTSRPVAGQPATDSPSVPWAFEGAQVIDQSTTQGAVTVTESGQYVGTDLLEETSTGPFTAYLEAEHGAVVTFSYGLCTPSCSSPSYDLTASVTATEWSLEFLNVSLRASTGQGVAAIGVVNASVRSVSTLNASSGTTGTGLVPASADLDARSTEQFTAAFSPALPLFPIGALTGPSWSGSSTATLSGGWTASDQTTYAGVSTPDGSSSSHQALPTSGTVNATAQERSAIELSSGETVVPQSSSVAGAGLRLVDGLFLRTTGASVFSPVPGTVAPPVAINLTTTAVDFDAAAAGHLGIAASSTLFLPTIAAPPGAPPAPSGADVGSFEPAGWAVQGEPEPASVATAWFERESFVPAQIVSASHGGTGGSPGLPIASLAVIVAAAAIGLVGAAAARWLPVPLGEPSRPNARPRPVPAARASTFGTEPADVLRDGAPTPSPREPDPFDDLL